MYNIIQEKYTELLQCYMEPKYVRNTDLSKIDPENETYFLPNSNMYLGVEVMEYLKRNEIKENSQSLSYFYHSCKNFFKVLCKEIKKRFDFQDSILSHLHIFTPKNALSFEIRQQYPSLFPIFEKLKRFIDEDEGKYKQIIDDEWRSLPNYIFPDGTFNEYEEIDVFWGKLHKFKAENEEYVFKTISKYVLNILSLPHSNASCERIFSIANSIKTKSRNRLIVSTINGALLSREFIAKSKQGCVDFNITKDMLGRMTTPNLYPQKQQETALAPSLSSSDEDDFQS